MRSIRIRRTTTMMQASSGTATTSPSGPSSDPAINAPRTVSTGGRSTRLDITSGDTTFPSITWTTTPTPITSNAFENPAPLPSTNNAGSTVASNTPNTGISAANPLNTPKVSQYGTPTAANPIAVSPPRMNIVESCPTM